MPSDDRIPSAIEALAAQREVHQSAVATAVEEVRGYLDSHRAETNGRTDNLSAELGRVGARHIDTDRFASLVATGAPLDSAAETTTRRALDTLLELTNGSNDRFVVSVPTGGSLAATVAEALAKAGRAFGAARVVTLARNGAFRSSEHDGYLSAFPFGAWAPGERRLAPPLVVEVDGADLNAASLAEFLDGTQKLVLIVRGDAPPAPLVRLICPGTFVAQSTDDSQLKRLALWEGPGIVALMPRTAARFVHDPAGGEDLASRLTVTELPTDGHRGKLGPFTAAQQLAELGQLQALSRVGPEAAAAGATATAPANPVDKLATWLLNQADLSGS